MPPPGLEEAAGPSGTSASSGGRTNMGIVTAPRPEERGFYGFATNALQPQCDCSDVSQSNVLGFTLRTTLSNRLPRVQVSKAQSARVALSAAATKIEQSTEETMKYIDADGGVRFIPGLKTGVFSTPAPRIYKRVDGRIVLVLYYVPGNRSVLSTSRPP